MPDTAKPKPAIDMHGHKIVQVGIVVADAARTARNYSRLFGAGPWTFYDMLATDVTLHNRRLTEAEGCVRAAMANIGGIEIELLQPVYGPGTHMEFLRQRGEGIHHVSFGLVDNHDAALAVLQRQGIAIEMQGKLGGAVTFSYMDTVRELGTIFEFVKAPDTGVRSTLAPWGQLSAPAAPAAVGITGKRVAQLGFVVDDAEKMARRYEELLGIGPWRLWVPVPQADAANTPVAPGQVLHGVPMVHITARTKVAFCEWEGLQFELIQPLAGPSTHFEYLKTQGNGIHHLSFGPVNDHDAMVAAYAAAGIGIEMAGALPRDAQYTYMDTRRELGTIWEMVRPGK